MILKKFLLIFAYTKTELILESLVSKDLVALAGVSLTEHVNKGQTDRQAERHQR